MSKRNKRTKAAKTTEQQAADEGWVYVFGLKITQGWESIWVEGPRERLQEVEGKAQRP